MLNIPFGNILIHTINNEHVKSSLGTQEGCDDDQQNT